MKNSIAFVKVKVKVKVDIDIVFPKTAIYYFIGAADKPCGGGSADVNPKLLLNDT